MSIGGVTIAVKVKRGFDLGAFNDFLHVEIFHSVKFGEDISAEVEGHQVIEAISDNLNEHILQIRDRWQGKNPQRMKGFNKLRYILVPVDEDTEDFELEMEEA